MCTVLQLEYCLWFQFFIFCFICKIQWKCKKNTLHNQNLSCHISCHIHLVSNTLVFAWINQDCFLCKAHFPSSFQRMHNFKTSFNSSTNWRRKQAEVYLTCTLLIVHTFSKLHPHIVNQAVLNQEHSTVFYFWIFGLMESPIGLQEKGIYKLTLFYIISSDDSL